MKTVYLVDGSRTPFLIQSEYQSAPHHSCYSAQELAVIAIRHLLLRQPFNTAALDKVIIGSSNYKTGVDLAQHIAQRLGATAGFSQSQYGTLAGLQALEYGHLQIALNQQQLVLVAATDVLPAQPARWNKAMYNWLDDYSQTSSWSKKFKAITRSHPYQPRHYLSTPTQRTNITRYAEKKALIYRLQKAQMSEYVQLSQRRLQYAQRNNLIASLAPLFYEDGRWIHRDQGILDFSVPPTATRDSCGKNDNMDILTANSLASATEGASALLLASRKAVKRYQLPVLAKLSTPQWTHSPDNKNMLKDPPNTAIEHALKKHQLSVDDIDYWEWNETTAVEVLAAQQHYRHTPPVATLSHVNVDGGALALGAPATANSLRMILQLSYILRRNAARYGIVSSTEPGGKAFALLLQHEQEAEA